MGALRPALRLSRNLFIFLVFFSFLSGCQLAYVPTKAKLVEHLEQVDDQGLADQANVPELKTSGAFPVGWTALPVQSGPMYTHRQWRSPSKRTAVGVTYVRMPLPLPTKTLVWFALQEAGKKTNGKIIRQWKDDLGREWFEAENDKYHMTGYVMTRGFDAWINYCGYRVTELYMPKEADLGSKALDTILPVTVREKEKLASAR